MFSRGPPVLGTDGTDFVHRQTIASHYQRSFLLKSRLSFCLFLHFLLFLLMAFKLIDNILDRMDIFVLSLQELFIPKPNLWEYIWAISIVFSLLAKRSLQKNSIKLMRIYIAMLFSFSFLPVIYAAAFYFADIKKYLITRDLKQIDEVWQGLPISLLWYGFLFVAFQLHVAQLVFTFSLINIWSKNSKRKNQKKN